MMNWLTSTSARPPLGVAPRKRMRLDVRGRGRIVLAMVILLPLAILPWLQLFGVDLAEPDWAALMWGVLTLLTLVLTYAGIGAAALLAWMRRGLTDSELAWWAFLRKGLFAGVAILAAFLAAPVFRYEIIPLGYNYSYLRHDRFSGKVSREAAPALSVTSGVLRVGLPRVDGRLEDDGPHDTKPYF